VKKENDNRSHIRFNPDIFDIAIIGDKLEDFQNYDDSTSDFSGRRVALISDESYSGCSLIISFKGDVSSYLNPGEKHIVKVGRLNPMNAEVKWKKILDSHVLHVGFEYLE
jgi:hypothetical protein